MAFGNKVALGNRGGDFSTPIVLPFFLTAVADVNGDGVLDVFGYIPEQRRRHVPAPSRVLLHRGINVAAADFTADGIVDVVVTNYFGMYFLRGRGDGAFDPPVAFVLQGNQPDQQQVITSADFNRDGKPDLLTCGAFCSIRLGDGDGNFQTPQRLDFGQAGYRYLVADFDNDGLPDIAVMDSGKVELLLNRNR